MWNPFKRTEKVDPKVNSTESSGDMRDTPVDNPLDYREDGSIRPGDPAYDFMMSVLDNGKPAIANQQDDGTWVTETLDTDDDKEEENN